MKLQEVKLRTIRLPLIRPYVLSYRTFTEFEPIIVEVRDGDGRVGWGEGHISPGSSRETRVGGWAFCRDHAAAVIGKDTKEAKAMIAANLAASKVAATAMLTDANRRRSREASVIMPPRHRSQGPTCQRLSRL